MRQAPDRSQALPCRAGSDRAPARDRAPRKHAHQRCDAHSAGDEDRRQVDVRVDDEAPGRSLHIEDVAIRDLVMEPIGREPGRQFRTVLGCRHTFDCDAVALRTWNVGVRAAACARRRNKAEREDLSREAGQQRHTVDGRKQDRELRVQRVLEFPADHAKSAPTDPGSAVIVRRRTAGGLG